TSSTEIAVRSEADSELTLPGQEEQARDHEQGEAPRQAGQQGGGVGRDAAERVAPRGQEAAKRVDVEDPLVALRNLGGGVENGRDVEPDPQHVGQEVGE